jgi:hypothetical protein
VDGPAGSERSRKRRWKVRTCSWKGVVLQLRDPMSVDVTELRTDLWGKEDNEIVWQETGLTSEQSGRKGGRSRRWIHIFSRPV